MNGNFTQMDHFVNDAARQLEVARRVDNVLGDTSLVYLSYNSNFDVSSRQQKSTCLDVESMQSDAMGHIDAPRPTLGIATLRYLAINHLYTKSNQMAEGIKMPKDRPTNKTFYELLKDAGDLHALKAHDYASDEDPYGNYKFAGMMSKLFDNTDDAGFMGRIGEKIYRLANLENNNKTPKNEAIEDTERDLCVIMVLWMSQRKDRRRKEPDGQAQ
jgi:hypothetical protein